MGNAESAWPAVADGRLRVLAYEWAVTLPILARDAFDGDASVFGAMSSVMGVGAVLGGLAVAGRMQPTRTWLLNGALTFSLFMILTASAPTFQLTLLALLLLGGASIAFRSTATALIQLRAPAGHARPRAVPVRGDRGGNGPARRPLGGWLAEVIGIRAVLLLGGFATGIAAIFSSRYVERHAPEGRPPAALWGDPP